MKEDKSRNLAKMDWINDNTFTIFNFTVFLISPTKYFTKMTSKIKSYAHYQATATTIFHSSSITPKTHLEKLHLYFENFHSRKFIWRYHQQPFVGRLMSSLSEIAEIILMSNSFYKAPEYTQGNQVHITLNSLVPGRFEKRFR